jgi:hypothetical protein
MALYAGVNYNARVTLPERMQLVQTLMRFTVPPSFILTDWMLAFHFLLVWRLECETLLPDVCPFPHIAHFLDISHLLSYYSHGSAAAERQTRCPLASKHVKNMIP